MKKFKQPCSIYNLFFQLERECLLHDYIPTRSQDILQEIVNCCKEGQNIYESRDHDQRPLRYRHLTLPNNWFKSGRSKRKHRKTNLPFSFVQLNEIISKRWELADEETKAYLKKIASSEWKIYRANHKKCLEHNMANSLKKETNNGNDGKNNMALGSLKHEYDPFSTSKSSLEIKITPSYTKKQLHKVSDTVNSTCECDKTNLLLLPQEPCRSPHFSTSNTLNMPVDAVAVTNYPDPNQYLSILQVQQEHKFVESVTNDGLRAQREYNLSSMPVIQQQTKHMNLFNGHFNDINNGSSKSKSEFKDKNLHQFQQEGARTWFDDNSYNDPMASFKELKSDDSQKLLSFAQDLVTIHSSLSRVAERMQSHNAQMHHGTFMFRCRDQKRQVHCQDQNHPFANESGFYRDQKQYSPVNSTFITGNAFHDEKQFTVSSTCTMTACDKCRKFSFHCQTGSSFWHGFECTKNCSQFNNLNERETDTKFRMCDPISVGLEFEETEIDDCDFPPGSFHPVDDSLAFHPNGGPYGI